MILPKMTEKLWIQPLDQGCSNRALLRVDGERWPDDINGEPNLAVWIKVIEYAAYEKLKAENERLKSELSIADLKTHKEQDLRILALLNECDTLKAKLVDAEAELDNKRGAMMLEIKRLHELADREREAAKVMREAWRQSLELFTPNPGEELTEYGEGAKQTIEQMREQYEEALAKADEIRGKNE